MRHTPLILSARRLSCTAFALAAVVGVAPGCDGSDDCSRGLIKQPDGTCRKPGTGVGGSDRGPGPLTAVCDAAPSVKINEVLYDPEGNEGDVTTSFIELKGPQDTPLDDWVIERRKKAGKDGAFIRLAGAIGPSGYFVIGEGKIVGVDGVADMVSDKADGQNGTYAFRLFCNRELVDAVGYGDWTPKPAADDEGTEAIDEEAEAPDPFPGELAPASSASEGFSIARCPDGGDTDNNARDFAATTPSPGAASIDCPEPPPECPPEASAPGGDGADIIFNELAASSVEFNEGEGRVEFVELVNISAGALDLGDHTLVWNPNEEENFSKSKRIPAGTCVPVGGALLLWGGAVAAPTGAGIVVISAARLTIRDSGGELRLIAPGGAVLETFCYNEEGCPTQPAGVSITRDPDGDPNAPWVRHDQAERSAGAPGSPGACQNGDAFDTGCTRMPDPPEIEPDPACEDAAPTGLMINEVGFMPPTGGYEFVELYNPGGAPAAIAGLTVSDFVGVKHTFADDEAPIAAGGIYLVLAISEADCPAADGDDNPFEAGVRYACTGSLGLNNGGDTVTLSNGDPTADVPEPGLVITDQVIYGADEATACLPDPKADTSYTRAPDGGAGWRPHISANPALAQSPGLRVDGSRF